MHRYAAYGLTVESEIALPELVGADACDDGAHKQRCSVMLGAAPPALDRSTPTPLAWARRGDACLFYPDVAVYHVIDGHRIVVEPAAGADERVVRLFLLGPALAVLLHQRGLLVLHASSVSIDGRAIAFAAEKGEGKSTLAAALHARGHPLVADDVLAIDLNCKDTVRVFPGFPQLKLAPDSASQLSATPHELPLIHPELDKRAGRADRGFTREPVTLDRIFILRSADTIAIRRLAPQQRFVELVRHSYLAPMLRSTGESAQHFQQVIDLASRVPVSELNRPREMGLIEQTARHIETRMREAR